MKAPNDPGLWAVIATLWVLNFVFSVLIVWAGLNGIAGFGFSFWQIVGIGFVVNFTREAIATATDGA